MTDTDRSNSLVSGRVVADPAAPRGSRPVSDLLTVMTRSTRSGPAVVAAFGEVDWYSGPLLQDSLLAHVRPDGPPLVVDLTGVSFLGAAGLTVLLAVRRDALVAGTRLCLVAYSRTVLMPLTITGLDRVFDIHPALADALSCPGGGTDE